jgi:NADH-quinone oxidoreductase subunit G
MLNLEIDGRLCRSKRRTVMDAANQLGIYMPVFLLSQKAVDRGELPDVPCPRRKAPKALPACATPAPKG